MKKITKDKIYELKITDDMEDESGIDSISLVDQPAIEINWIAFSKEKEHEFHIPDGQDQLYLEKLIPFGQDEQELLDEGYEIDSIEYQNKNEFIYSNPNQPSDLDTNLFRIRYKYVLNPEAGGKPIMATTRDFCKELINKNLVFRLEDMLNQVNDQGSSFADWRGGYNCRHLFAKIVYKNRGHIDRSAKGKDTQGYDILGDTQNDTRVPEWPSFSKQGFVGEKISIDFDDTLSTPRGEALARHLISQGYNVYVVTRRQKSMSAGVYKVTDEIGIPKDKVIFTKGKLKWSVLKELGVKRHYDNSEQEIKAIRENAPKIEAIKFNVEQMESHTDYPDSVKNNAKAVLKWVEENGWGSCGTPVGKTRVNQLAKGEPISEDTIKRMYSYLSRHKVDLQSSKGYGDGCGKLMYDSWGGLSALSWAESKVKTFGYDNVLPPYVNQLPKKKKKEFIDEFDYLKSQDLSKQYFQTDEEKRTIVGPAMVPDMLIFRRDVFGNPYKVFFTRETISQIAEKYMRNKYLDNNDLMHDGKAVNDVYVIESWIVEDPETDKSKKYGFDVPAGTWMIAMKCAKTPKGDEVWNKVKNHELNGFSVSGFFVEEAASFAEELFLQQVVQILNKIEE